MCRSFVVLLLVAAVLVMTPGAQALFGLRGGGKESTASPGAAAPSAQSLQNTTGNKCASPGTKGGHVRQADSADPYPLPPILEDLQDYEAWEDEKGELHIIRAERAPSGEFSFPEGTTVRFNHAS